jgi:hypothetical protein
LFSPDGGELFDLCRRWNITVPELLWHDLDANVLILGDLGELETLTEELTRLTSSGESRLGGHQTYDELGLRLGGFFADLHSSSTLDLLCHKSTAYFDNRSVIEVIYENVVLPIGSYLDKLGIPDAEKLHQRIIEDYLRPDQPWENSFMLGDLWTGSILLDWPKACVIDWEFAQIGRGTSCDMATFLAQLHLHLLESSVESPAYLAVQTLIRSTVRGYRLQGSKYWNDGDTHPKGSKENGVGAATMPKKTMRRIRTSFIVHGRKMINNVVERDWHCDCCKGQAKDKKNCKVIAKMVDRGVWYLKMAGNDLEEFAQEANWSGVMAEEGKVILGMFIDD